MSRFWLRLDNAALIFPAIRRPGWSNVFRQSATLTEDIDPVILQEAADDLQPRFPSLYVRLRAGMFWYYLEDIRVPLQVRKDFAYPLTYMSKEESRQCCLRILYYKNRIAVEFFHSVTDGNGATVFLRTLVARYVELCYGVTIPAERGVLDITQPHTEEEISDAFQKHSGRFPMNPIEPNAYRLKGTREKDGFRHLITGVVSSSALLEAAHRYGVSVTSFLTAVMAQCVLDMQAQRVIRPLRKPVKITVAVDLRRLFKSGTLRNFALALNLGVDARFAPYSLEDLCKIVSHQMAAETVPQLMAARIAANVLPQKLLILRIMPLFLKNLLLRTVYMIRGETKGSLNISNLGRVELPQALAPYVQRLEFIIGTQITYPNNCSVISCGDVTCINMIRNIREAELERRFFSTLVELGVPVAIESNERAK